METNPIIPRIGDWFACHEQRGEPTLEVCRATKVQKGVVFFLRRNVAGNAWTAHKLLETIVFVGGEADCRLLATQFDELHRMESCERDKAAEKYRVLRDSLVATAGFFQTKSQGDGL